MVIVSSTHLGELRTIFLEGVTRSSKILWSSVKISWGTNNRGKAPPAITGEIPIPFKQTFLAPFDDHMAVAHGSHVTATHR